MSSSPGVVGRIKHKFPLREPVPYGKIKACIESQQIPKLSAPRSPLLPKQEIRMVRVDTNFCRLLIVNSDE